MELSSRRIGIIGAGHVGAHCAHSLALLGLADELILVDRDEKRADAEVQDLSDAAGLFPHRVDLRRGACEDLGGCDIVILSAGEIPTTRDRLDELYGSAAIVDEVIPRTMRAGFGGIFLVVTNPCDIVAHRVWQRSGLEASRVIGTGTGLDSMRLVSALAQKTGVSPQSITACVIGEHGESQVPVWSQVCFGFMPLQQLTKQQPERFGALDLNAVAAEVRRAGWVALEGKGATEYGIAAAVCRLVGSILHDEKRLIAASTLLTGQYGQSGVFAGIPCVVGKNGVEQVVAPALSRDEQSAFSRSCEVIREHLRTLEPQAPSDERRSAMSIQPPDPAPSVPEHDCNEHSSYTCGPLGWGWYCQICGSFAEIDDMPEG